MLTRRGFFKAVGGVGLFAAGAGLGAGLGPQLARHVPGSDAAGGAAAGRAHDKCATVPFWGNHQAGIVTPQQAHTYFSAFDLVTEKRGDVAAMLRAWTQAAAAMTGGQLNDAALGLGPARLTLTFGFGPGLFVKDGKDRYGLAALRPAALVDMPRFNGDQLIPEKTGGDLSVQACADDPQVAFHAIRQLVKLAGEAASIRWAQTGFASGSGGQETPRNLQGFKDGTQNPRPKDMDRFVWTGSGGPAWMQGGSYLVVRRIRIALEHWDTTEVEFQEQVIGRHKVSGAPLGGGDEFEPLNLDATDKDGNYLIPEHAHVRLASGEANGGTQVLRRGYSYNDGANFTAERWPPWRQGIEYDAGLLFIAYQRDPRDGFIKLFDKMAKLDALNQFTTHTGSGLFACPGGVNEGEFIGQRLFETV
jgi:deferrochelatase/peroxidase EfeB